MLCAIDMVPSVVTLLPCNIALCYLHIDKLISYEAFYVFYSCSQFPCNQRSVVHDCLCWVMGIECDFSNVKNHDDVAKKTRA